MGQHSIIYTQCSVEREFNLCTNLCNIIKLKLEINMHHLRDNAIAYRQATCRIPSAILAKFCVVDGLLMFPRFVLVEHISTL